VALLLVVARASAAQQDAERLEGGRFTVVAYRGDATLARSVLAAAQANDTFPGLPRSHERVVVLIAPDRRRFREWIGPTAPEWGAAIAIPELRRIVMQGHNAGADAGDPLRTLRHELAHLALHEAMGNLPPHWFDEGYASYAAGELEREATLETNVAIAFRGTPTFASLDSALSGSAFRAEPAYAMSYRAIVELASLDRERGLSLLFKYWRQTGSLDVAVRQAYGMTLFGFENRWQRATRQRYGALALVTDLSLAAALTLIFVGPLYVVRRRRDRMRMAALLRADEEAERRERESVIDELLRTLPPAPPPARDEPS
jgi:hypothetical protein